MEIQTLLKAETITLTIDGVKVQTTKGKKILEAALDAGIYIPNLCALRDLEPPTSACLLCLVQIEGKAATVTACSEPAVAGMVVHNNTPEVNESRRKMLRILLARHPSICLTCHRRVRCKPGDVCLRLASVDESQCILCAKNGRCDLQRAVDFVGLEEMTHEYIPKKLPVREDSPFFVRDNNFCILCQRCVRVCDHIRGVRAIEFAYPCHKACPAGIDIPRYLRLIALGRPSAALAVIREKVPFPGALGRVCVHPCETACQRGREVDKPLSIRMMKRFAADNGDGSWKAMSRKLPPTGKKVAVVGAGPASLTAAFYLAKQGHETTVFEALPEAGGMMRVGIPEYRLPRDILASEIDDIKNFGVELRLNSRVDSLDTLFDQGFSAVFLGLGAHEGMRLGVDGDDLPGVIESADFLRRINLGERINVGETVGVVGGGNVAIDAARVSLRLGAKKVTILYRRTRAEMPANPEEVDAALEEGIEIIYLAAPSKIVREGGKIKLECIRMELGEPDASGRRRPVPIEGSEFTTELDTLVSAIGQRTHVPEGFQVELGRGNAVKVDGEMRTTRAGVFSGGDCVSGPATVIEAIAAGRKAAESIDRYLGGTGDISESLVPAGEIPILMNGLPAEKTAVFSHLHPEERIRSFDEVEMAVAPGVAAAESVRCLQCNVIAPPADQELKEAGCQFCGACVDVCPVGALIERGVRWAGPSQRTVTTICPYCGVGCQLNIEVKDEKIIRVAPDEAGPANSGQACVKGKFGMDFVQDESRLTSPLIKRNGKFEEAGWEEALDLVASRLARYKGNQFAAISSAKCTNEDNYVFQKFTRAVMNTNNIDHCARLCHAPTVAGLATSFGSGAMTNSIAEIGEARCVFAIGTNTTEDHPVIAVQIQRALDNGGNLIVADPRRIDLCKKASFWLRHRPGTDTALLMGMARVILDEGLHDRAFIEERCENFHEFKDSLKAFGLSEVSRITDVPASTIAKAARLYATSKPTTILYCMGITQHSHGTDNVLAIANLAMLTGNIGKPASGVNPLRGQNNVQGACDMGALPGVFTAYQSVASPVLREKFEAAWGCALPGEPGTVLTEMFHAVDAGKIKAMYVIGENPVLSDPDAGHIGKSLDRLEFLVVQDLFLTETAKLADVVLPAASFAEKDGTFTNTERRIQRVRQVVSPVGNSRPDWRIVSDLAARMGAKGFSYSEPSEIMKEISDLSPSYGGVNYDRLDNGGLQWPCPFENHPGTEYLHGETFVRGKGKFSPLEYKAPAEQPDKDYPLLLSTGRSLYQFHTGSMTRKTKGLNQIKGEEMVEISPEDARDLDVSNGEIVQISSRRGKVKAKAKITGTVPKGMIFMTFHFAESATNLLTNPALDPVSKIPEFKVCAVRVDKIS
ncbi:MAG: formate dehydrogenase subunit alpha [Dehalococcoidia bacterium]|nr:formate dehydrogenase subunit alpha [Dehalococcoidia bacterium]